MGVGGSPNQFIAAANVNLTGVAQAGGCTYANASATANCTFDAGNTGVLSTLIAFGDFIWSLARMFALLPIVVALPAVFLIQNFYAPPLIAGIYNIAIWVIYIFWINSVVANRYVFEIE
jgi:hypothetical protein